MLKSQLVRTDLPNRTHCVPSWRVRVWYPVRTVWKISAYELTFQRVRVHVNKKGHILAVTKVAVVTVDLNKYKEAFLYALATVWNVDSVVNLEDSIAQAAMGLADVPSSNTQVGPIGGPPLPIEGDDENGLDLPYDDLEWSLEGLFLEAWNRSRDPECARFDLKKALDDLPIIDVIPRKAQDNNHGTDGKGLVDRVHKGWQQKLLHALRILGVVSLSDDGEDTFTKLLQVFHLLSDLEQNICDFRKTQSVRGSVTQPNQLFNKEEIAAANLAHKINRLSRTGAPKGGKGGKGGKGSWGSNFRQFGKGKGRGQKPYYYNNSYSKGGGKGMSSNPSNYWR